MKDNANNRPNNRWLSSLFLVVVLYLSWPYFQPSLSAPYGLLFSGASSLLAGELLVVRNAKASTFFLIIAPVLGLVGVTWLCIAVFM